MKLFTKLKHTFSVSIPLCDRRVRDGCFWQFAGSVLFVTFILKTKCKTLRELPIFVELSWILLVLVHCLRILFFSSGMWVWTLMKFTGRWIMNWVSVRTERYKSWLFFLVFNLSDFWKVFSIHPLIYLFFLLFYIRHHKLTKLGCYIFNWAQKKLLAFVSVLFVIFRGTNFFVWTTNCDFCLD